MNRSDYAKYLLELFCPDIFIHNSFFYFDAQKSNFEFKYIVNEDSQDKEKIANKRSMKYVPLFRSEISYNSVDIFMTEFSHECKKSKLYTVHLGRVKIYMYSVKKDAIGNHHKGRNITLNLPLDCQFDFSCKIKNQLLRHKRCVLIDYSSLSTDENE